MLMQSTRVHGVAKKRIMGSVVGDIKMMKNLVRDWVPMKPTKVFGP